MPPSTFGTTVAPVVATIAVIVTLVTCVSVAKASNKYLGGLTWPYLSDTGRDTLTVIVLIEHLQTFVSFKLSRVNKILDIPGYTTDLEVPKSSNLVNPWNSTKLSMKRTFYTQLIFTTLFLVAFLLYIPIGLALVSDFQRLTVKDVRRAIWLTFHVV
ncbi:unnamed protein product [Phytophthora fragariaefolia]|uniref:Unnamed protein product n=1 Tax=Phytophthora fragariaefolia TaxID=1490495 RepID=A0A9W6U971_9STRA|nr:unnamed protein product [Phytophthora fragariaefolia]